MEYYKIVDVVNGKIRTLFHSINGFKLYHERPEGTWYTSGWHVLRSKGECEKYMNNFTNTKYKQILKCKVRGEVRPKEHSRDNVFLADEIYFY